MFQVEQVRPETVRDRVEDPENLKQEIISEVVCLRCSDNDARNLINKKALNV